MLNARRLLLAGALIAPASLLALRQTYWLALNPTPAMGHISSPASQEITKNTTTYTLTASVTDLDTFQANTELKDKAQLSGLEGDVSIESNVRSANILAVNRSFDAASGKREETYVIKSDNKWLLDKGDVAYIKYTFKGVDNMSDPARHDPDTTASECLVALKYVSPPAPPPKGGI